MVKRLKLFEELCNKHAFFLHEYGISKKINVGTNEWGEIWNFLREYYAQDEIGMEVTTNLNDVIRVTMHTYGRKIIVEVK